ncbi:hypothetical protein GOODEAATRI_023316 [Goodea atripinnis]|uniref:Uncharacterized protein n=1 Tax=Goodea atripinnis TaxID=208336 RepID=A0ABV0Q0G6_9TELE
MVIRWVAYRAQGKGKAAREDMILAKGERWSSNPPVEMRRRWHSPPKLGQKHLNDGVVSDETEQDQSRKSVLCRTP